MRHQMTSKLPTTLNRRGLLRAGLATRHQIFLGHFRAPPQYTGEWRCDTHPRHSRDGQLVVIDAPEASTGRQLRLIDISGIAS